MLQIQDYNVTIKRRGKPGLLSARFVETVTEPGLYADGARLYLRVDPSGAKRWIFRYRLRGKQSDLGLGSFFMVSLREARYKAVDVRRLIDKGIDPLRDKRDRVAAEKLRKTYCQAFEAMIDAKRKAKISERYLKDLIIRNQQYCAPLQNLYVDQIQQSTVVDILASGVRQKTNAVITRSRGKKPSLDFTDDAKFRVRQLISQVCAYSKAQRWRSGDNPAAWDENLKELQLLPAIRKVVHFDSLDYNEAPLFMADLQACQHVRSKHYKSPDPVYWQSLAVQILLLTGMRIGAVRFAKWKEVDKGIWTVPAELGRKIKEPFLVPLSWQAREILKKAFTFKISEQIFPGDTGGVISPGSLLGLIHKLRPNIAITAHGFRSTFRDWSGAETNYPRDLLEESLTHKVEGGDVEAAYKRKPRLIKRAALLQDWADFLTGKTVHDRPETLRFVPEGQGYAGIAIDDEPS